MPPVRSDSLLHVPEKNFISPTTDAGLRVRCDVGRVESAEIRFHGIDTGLRFAIVFFICVATGETGGMIYLPPFLKLAANFCVR